MKNLLKLLSLTLLIAFLSSSSVNAAVTCDGTHVHSADFNGLHIPCTGSVWRSSTDNSKIYIQGYWSSADAASYDESNTNEERCSEWQWFYDSAPSDYTWYMNWSGNDDYDSGEKHIDLHSTYTGYAACDS